MMALLLLADMGIQHGMPDGISNACVICHVESFDSLPAPNDAKLDAATSSSSGRPKLLEFLTHGYPNRIHQVWITTTNPSSSGRAVELIQTQSLFLLPDELILAQRLVVCNGVNQECQQRLTEGVLLNGWEDLPTFLGGPNQSHGHFYPEGKHGDSDNDASSSRGESLEFDFYGMKERLMEQRMEYEERMR